MSISEKHEFYHKRVSELHICANSRLLTAEEISTLELSIAVDVFADDLPHEEFINLVSIQKQTKASKDELTASYSDRVLSDD